MQSCSQLTDTALSKNYSKHCSARGTYHLTPVSSTYNIDTMPQATVTSSRMGNPCETKQSQYPLSCNDHKVLIQQNSWRSRHCTQALSTNPNSKNWSRHSKPHREGDALSCSALHIYNSTPRLNSSPAFWEIKILQLFFQKLCLRSCF